MSKPKRNRNKPVGPAGPAARSETPADPAAPRRRWLVRLAGVVLLPLLVLAVAEAGLRLAGYGYLTTFFKPARIGNRDCLVENDKFGLRFFPPELARSPPPVVMEARKPAGVRRLFVLGESAALGDPRPGYGAGRYLQVLLEERFPGTKFEVICVAMTAINSHAVLSIARECARHEGDLWIVYMGNNEMVGPFGACTVFGSQAPPLWRVRLVLALQQTRLGQWLTALGRKLGSAPGRGGSWGGMKMFMESQIAPDDPRKEVVYRSFRRNLADLVQAGRAAGVPVLLSTVAVNLKDCPPFASLSRPTLPEAARQSCARLSAEALAAEKAGDFSRAAGIYAAAAELDPGFAEFHFRRGHCLLALADRDRTSVAAPSELPRDGTNPAPTSLLASARVSFECARDADALPFRADSRINAVIREVAAATVGPGLEFCDAVGLLATNSPVGIPGQEAFYEHVHFNFDGNYLLARAWAEAVGRRLSLEAPGAAPGKWAPQEVCERRLALTDWNRYAVLEDLLQRLASPPFTEQFQHSQQVEHLRGQLQEVRRRLTRSAGEEARQVSREALQRAPQDYRLHENAAQFLEGIGDLSGAAFEWREVRGLIPQHHAAYFQEGRLLARLGNPDAAATLLGQAVALRPDLVEGWLELGNVHASQRHFERSLEDYRRGLDLAPQDSRFDYFAGKSLSKLNRPQPAIDHFLRALQLRSDYWEARYALGEELAFAGQETAARKEFEEVLRLKPDNVMAHINLAVGLLKAKDTEGAVRHFEEAARLDPKNPVASEYLGKLRSARK